MGKHNKILPPTVEELAAQDRTPRTHSTRPAIIVAATVALLIVGATAWAVSRPQANRPPTVAGAESGQPTIGAIEGFGAAGPTQSPSRPARPSAQPLISANPPTEPTQSTLEISIITRYRITAWPGAYKADLYLTNPGSEPRLWTARVELPPGASLQTYWNAQLDSSSGGVLMFSAPHWDAGNPRPVAPGIGHEFGFIVTQTTGSPGFAGCTVNGSACQPL